MFFLAGIYSPLPVGSERDFNERQEEKNERKLKEQ